MTYSFEIPDDIAPDLIDSVCAATGYKPELNITQSEHVRNVAIAWFKRLAKQGRFLQARDQISAAVDAITIN